MKPGRKWLGRAGAAFLGLVLLVAAIAKGTEPGPFVDQIRQEGLDFLLPAPHVALLAIALEAVLGVGLLLGFRRLWLLVPSGALVAFFLFLTGRNYWLVSRGLREEGACGCFGSWIERTPAEALWQDALLLVPALALALWGRRRAGPERFLTLRLILMLAVPLILVVVMARGPDFRYVQVAEEIAAAGTHRSSSQFDPSEGYDLWVDGSPISGSGVFQSDQRIELLILTPVFEAALLLHPGRGEVFSLSRQQVHRGPGKTLYLEEGVQPRLVGPFESGPEGIAFTAQGRRLQLRARSG